MRFGTMTNTLAAACQLEGTTTAEPPAASADPDASEERNR
jgi:hypothetical protein